jgi:hypothetical protein
MRRGSDMWGVGDDVGEGGRARGEIRRAVGVRSVRRVLAGSVGSVGLLVAVVCLLGSCNHACAREQPIERAYNAMSALEGPHGTHWSSSLDMRVIPVVANGAHCFCLRSSGRRATLFREAGYHSYDNNADVDGFLQQDEAGLYSVHFKPGFRGHHTDWKGRPLGGRMGRSARTGGANRGWRRSQRGRGLET